MIDAQVCDAQLERTDRQTRPRDCLARRGTGDDQRSSIARRLAGRGNGRLFENTMGSTSWQGGALSTPDDTGFASIANALPDFESRTANVEWVRLVNSMKRMSFQAKSRNPWHCRELHRGILRLLPPLRDPLRMTERLERCHDLRVTRALALPTLAGIANRRQAFAKLRLLTFGLSLLLRFACLLLGTRT